MGGKVQGEGNIRRGVSVTDDIVKGFYGSRGRKHKEGTIAYG